MVGLLGNIYSRTCGGTAFQVMSVGVSFLIPVSLLFWYFVTLCDSEIYLYSRASLPLVDLPKIIVASRVILIWQAFQLDSVWCKSVLASLLACLAVVLSSTHSAPVKRTRYLLSRLGSFFTFRYSYCINSIFVSNRLTRVLSHL